MQSLKSSLSPPPLQNRDPPRGSSYFLFFVFTREFTAPNLRIRRAFAGDSLKLCVLEKKICMRFCIGKWIIHRTTIHEVTRLLPTAIRGCSPASIRFTRSPRAYTRESSAICNFFLFSTHDLSPSGDVYDTLTYHYAETVNISNRIERVWFLDFGRFKKPIERTNSGLRI